MHWVEILNGELKVSWSMVEADQVEETVEIC